jgi:hypothetical protein
MEALLIPLAKGFLGLIGFSSFMFLGAMRNAEVQFQQPPPPVIEIPNEEARPKVEPLKEIPLKK